MSFWSQGDAALAPGAELGPAVLAVPECLDSAFFFSSPVSPGFLCWAEDRARLIVTVPSPGPGCSGMTNKALMRPKGLGHEQGASSAGHSHRQQGLNPDSSLADHDAGLPEGPGCILKVDLCNK